MLLKNIFMIEECKEVGIVFLGNRDKSVLYKNVFNKVEWYLVCLKVWFSISFFFRIFNVIL